MMLACLLGIYTVLERSIQTKYSYRIASLLQKEKKLDEELLRAQLRLSQLMSPAHLDKLNQEMALNLTPLVKKELRISRH